MPFLLEVDSESNINSYKEHFNSVFCNTLPNYPDMQDINRTLPNVPMSVPATEAIFSLTAVRHQIVNLL